MNDPVGPRSSGRSVGWPSISSPNERKPPASPPITKRFAQACRNPQYQGGLLTEAGVDDECLGLGVVHDVADLGADQMPVHGGDVVPALERSETNRDLFEAVGQHRRDLVATRAPAGRARSDWWRVELPRSSARDRDRRWRDGRDRLRRSGNPGRRCWLGEMVDADATAPIEGSAEGFGRSRRVTTLRLL